MDAEWWKFHLPAVKEGFQGERLSLRQRPGVEVVRSQYLQQGSSRGQNSGAGAIGTAVARGARRVILLGYDCKHGADGRKHWHGDHGKGEGAGNAGSVGKWPAQFRELLLHLRGAVVINASRDTALTVFKRATLEEALA